MLEERQSAAGVTFIANQPICQLYDPHFVGDVIARRAKVFECLETSKEYIPIDPYIEETGRPLSPDTEAEYRPFSPGSLKILSVMMSNSQETWYYVDEYRALRKNAPIVLFSVSLPEAPMEHHRAPSSEPVTDIEFEQTDVAAFSNALRLSSPESERSMGKHRPVSPDSPVLDFRLDLHSSLTLVNSYSSSSPESHTSALEVSSGLFPSECCIQNGPESPDSVCRLRH